MFVCQRVLPLLDHCELAPFILIVPLRRGSVAKSFGDFNKIERSNNQYVHPPICFLLEYEHQWDQIRSLCNLVFCTTFGPSDPCVVLPPQSDEIAVY